MERNDRFLVGFLGLCGAIVFATLAWIAIHYGVLATYFDHAEPAAVIRAWRWLSGGAMFPEPDSLDFHLTAYGPVLHLLDAAALAWLGPSIPASKAAALAAAVLAPVILTAVALRRFGAVAGLLAGLALAAYELAMGPMILWVRPDPFLMLVMVLAVAAAPMDQSRTDLKPVRLLLLGVLVGVAVNLKVNAFLYFLPLLAAQAPHRFLFTWPAMAVVSVLSFLLPFALPGIDLFAYLHSIFAVAAGRPLDPKQLSYTLRMAVLCLAPWVPWLAARLGGRGATMAGLMPGLLVLTGCVALMIYPASAKGSNWAHLAPFMPVALLLTARGINALKGAPWGRLTAVVIVALSIGLTGWVPTKRTLRRLDTLAPYEAAADDLRAILAANPKASIEMGYGGDNANAYRNTFAVPLLVFAGHRQVLSAVATMEDRSHGLPPSAQVLHRLSSGAVDIVLIPTGEDPFQMNGFMEPGPAFRPEFHDSFVQGYRRAETIGRFDLWRPRRAG